VLVRTALHSVMQARTGGKRNLATDGLQIPAVTMTN